MARLAGSSRVSITDLPDMDTPVTFLGAPFTSAQNDSRLGIEPPSNVPARR